MRHTVLRLTLLCCSLLCCSLVGVTGGQLPEAMDDWNYGLNISKLRHSIEGLPVTRLWTRDDLTHAHSQVNYERLRPLVARLNSGQPINVVAFGDSVTAHFGGCFHSSVARYTQELPSALSNGRPADRFGRGWVRVTEKLSDCMHGVPLGWLSSFMSAINTTWPHPDHMLINNGVSGGTWGALSEACIEHRLPKRTDLIIFEHFPHLEGATPLDLERLLNSLRMNFGGVLPPVIFLNLVRASNAYAKDPTGHCITHSMSTCAAGQPCVAHFADRPLRADAEHFRQNETHAVARHYGLTSLSHAVLLQRLAERLEKQGISRCELLCSLYLDPLHPRDMGRLLLADMLTDLLERAVKALQPAPAAGTSSAVRSLVPMDTRSFLVRHLVCYAGNNAERFDSQVKPMNVIKSEGWAQELREGHDFWPGWVASTAGALLWVKLDASDVFASDQGHPDHGHGQQGKVTGALDIRITYLRSWRHMGQLEASCVRGCTCATKTLNAHEQVGQFSMPDAFDLGSVTLQQAAATQGRAVKGLRSIDPSTSSRLSATGTSGPLSVPAAGLGASAGHGPGVRTHTWGHARSLQQQSHECVIQVKVLSNTTSGEHKATILSVNMGAWRDLTDVLKLQA